MQNYEFDVTNYIKPNYIYDLQYGTNTNAGEGTITVSDKTGGNYNIIQTSKKK